MAYGLKYKASKTHENGDKYEVRIYRDGWTGASYGIGNLTRLSLSIQGDRAALTAPIIKTSLNIGMIDTPDKGSTKSDGTTCVDANGDKVGKWEEFYTNNPTLYKVELRYTGALTRNAVIWTGFLTPDSWGEDMTYGGTISLVARDMLGTLSEYEFDLTGDVTITQIVQGALTKCKCAMTATMRTSECLQNAGNSQSILTAKINASTFAGKSWYEALEQTLEGVGLILRYDGNNGFDCTSIRYAASHAVEGGENAHTPAFYNRSGYRTLDPAVKQIVEVFNPSIESIAPVEPSADDWTDTGDTLTQHYDTPFPHRQDFTYPKFSLAGGSSYFSGSGAIPFLDGSSDGPRDVPKVGIYFPVNLTTANRTTYKDPSLVAPFSLNLSNLVGTGFVELSEANGHYYFSRYFFDSPTAASVSISVSCRLNGTTYYWYKGWRTSETFFDANFDERITIPEKEGATDYAVSIRCINASEVGDGIIGNPLFVPLGIRIEPIDGNDVYGEYKTTTIYDEENHIEINRTPSIGAINSSTPAAFLPNVLHYGTTPASDKWRWVGENSAGLPLAVVIHQQLLVFNCAQNGNSIFTGDLLDLTSRVSVPGTNYDYFTRSCALLAGDYNCLSGYIEGVTLREIYDWDDVWDGVTPEYTEKESQAKGGTAASGGGGSSSGGGGGSSHTHPNKAVLDGITAEKVTSWDGAASKAHEHANKAALDLIRYDATNNVVYVGNENNRINLAAYGEVTAGGVGSGGSGGVNYLYQLEDVPDYRSLRNKVMKVNASGQIVWENETAGTITGAVMNGSTVQVTDGVLQLGTVLTEHQSIKTINSVSLIGSGNITLATLGVQPTIDASHKLAYSLISGTPDLSDMATKTYVGGVLSPYRKSADQDTIDNAIKGRLTTIEGLIPSAATTSNQLADKSFVNSSIATATATFRGTSASGLTEAQFLAWANGLTKDNNDYVFWNTTDSAGNVQFKRYKYNGTSWAYEYTLNNSSFTAAQWAAVNSGITSSLVTAFGNKYDKPSSGIPLTDLAQGVKDSLALADSALQSHQTIYALTVQKNGTTVGTYTPNSAAKTINIQDVASAQTLSDLKTWIESMFEKDTTSVSGQTLIKAKFSLYSEGEITAGGVGSGGGGGGGLASVYFNNTRADDGETAKFGIKINGSWAAVQTDSTYGKYININTATGVTAIKVNGGAAQTGEVSLTIPSAYTLPIASSSVLGGIKVGANLSINSSTGILSATDTTYSDATTSAHGLMSAADKTKLNGIAAGATAVTESTVSGWGFTKNTGTVTSVAVKMNGSTKGTVTASGTIDLGTVLTEHQSLAAYRKASDQDTIDNLLASCVQSLQSQIDSVAARDSYDELTATSLFADTLVGTNIYGALHGNADSATNADTLDGQHANYFQPLTTAINTGNIASQSVAYANGAGNADTVDSEHASAFAHRATWNNLIHSGNEFTYASAGYNGVIWHNYRTASGSTDGNITDYYFGNGKGGSLVALSTLISQSSHGETAYNDLATVSKALQSLQSQVDSVAVRSSFDEIVSINTYTDTLSARDGYFSGNILAYGELTAGYASDARFKSNRADLQNADRVLKNLRPMEFDWNELYHSLGGGNEGHDVGFLAQDVQHLIPSAIGKVYGDYLRLDYNKVIPYLVAGWQSNETRLQHLEQKVTELERQLNINS